MTLGHILSELSIRLLEIIIVGRAVGDRHYSQALLLRPSNVRRGGRVYRSR